jgi:hypothetical protein
VSILHSLQRTSNGGFVDCNVKTKASASRGRSSRLRISFSRSWRQPKVQNYSVMPQLMTLNIAIALLAFLEFSVRNNMNFVTVANTFAFMGLRVRMELVTSGSAIVPKRLPQVCTVNMRQPTFATIKM